GNFVEPIKHLFEKYIYKYYYVITTNRLGSISII
ncbi:unnamed protein product, partial [Brassica oleracea var. botrytis]